ncbi:F-box only protein 48-like [Diadema setosum]|uniref:F-box only protein 48-like n=1 Tax=Diadema setosum TaxID=31175 RepID=UPI003B3AA1C2
MSSGYLAKRAVTETSPEMSRHKNANSCDNFMWHLPPEVCLQIFSAVDIQSLCKAAQTCKGWNDVIEKTDYLWKILCQQHCEDWGDVMDDRASGYTWKETFQRNFAHQAIKRKWLRGDFSSFHSYRDLPSRVMCIMDVHTWGQILELELQR